MWKGNGFVHFVGPILLALKCLIYDFKTWAKDLAEDDKGWMTAAAKAALVAAKWAPVQPGVAAALDEFKTALAITVFVA